MLETLRAANNQRKFASPQQPALEVLGEKDLQGCDPHQFHELVDRFETHIGCVLAGNRSHEVITDTMEQIQRPKCKHHPSNELNIHCVVHSCKVCSTCTRESHKTCSENICLEQKKERNSTDEDVLASTDSLDTGIDSLQDLEEWKVTTKQEIEHLRERIIAHLDTIQRRSLVIMENIYTEEKQKRRQSLQEIKQIKRRGVYWEAISSAMDGNNDKVDEVKERLDRVNLSNVKRRPTLNKEMKMILQIVENISSGVTDINSDMIIGVLTKQERLVIEKEERLSIDFGCDFMEN
ncbi:hypothetical protein CHS0354_021785 [Potamilus streckersoni]|uniref:Uncharacterized protein n=1 Tax=Potamilus streckersoni TaxID=2493646 RepID=A0AAE0S497_9BIVA|nr:hypothetical protein CHS0354_021785 [Potamilus streckersoni]